MRRNAALLIAIAASAACNRGPNADQPRTDSAARTSAGDVSLDTAITGTVFHGVKYPLTSDNYRKWVVAQGALDSLPEPVAMPRVDLRDPTDDDIDRTVSFLSNDAAARNAIQRSELSVRDFVLTSLALGQAFNFANDELVPTENRAFVRSKREEIARVRQGRDFHVLDDDDDDEGQAQEHDRGHAKHHHHRDQGEHEGHDDTDGQ